VLNAILSFPQYLFRKLSYYSRHKQLPWQIRIVLKKIHLLGCFLIGFIYNPKKALQFFKLLIQGDMVERYFFTQIFGPIVLKETIQVCDSLDMKPFLNFGSLLGHYREGGIIQTDNDIDLGILEDESNKISLLEKQMKDKGYQIRIKTKLEISFIKKRYANTHIDFWRYYTNKMENECYCGFFITDDDNSVVLRNYPVHILNNFKRGNFIGVNVWIPFHTEKYLELTYGKEWKIPLDKGLSWEEKKMVLYKNTTTVTWENFLTQSIPFCNFSQK